MVLKVVRAASLLAAVFVELDAVARVDPSGVAAGAAVDAVPRLGRTGYGSKSIGAPELLFVSSEFEGVGHDGGVVAQCQFRPSPSEVRIASRAMMTSAGFIPDSVPQ